MVQGKKGSVAALKKAFAAGLLGLSHGDSQPRRAPVSARSA
jgi:hypothetical protein